MFSLVILYSTDRRRQLEQSLTLWQDVRGFSSCEKILCVDGETDWHPPGFRVLSIRRPGPYYCWADALNAGVSEAKHPFVFYFDSDRVVPVEFFELGMAVLEQENAFVFAESLYSLASDATIDELRQLRDDPSVPIYRQRLIEDHRVLDPESLGYKNPLAGGVGFRQLTFLDHGGFDRRFVGWGYPDYDFFMNVYRAKRAKFCPLDVAELHLHHPYQETPQNVMLHNLWNCRQYVEKWQIDTPYLEECRKWHKVSTFLYEASSLEELLDHETKHSPLMKASA